MPGSHLFAVNQPLPAVVTVPPVYAQNTPTALDPPQPDNARVGDLLARFRSGNVQHLATESEPIDGIIL
jgi:hypothetical protein